MAPPASHVSARRGQALPIASAARLLLVAAAAARVTAFSAGYTACTDAPGGPHNRAFGTGTLFQLTFTTADGAPAVSYVGGQQYLLTLSGAVVGEPSFAGLYVSGFAATQAVLGTAFAATPTAGQLEPVRVRDRKGWTTSRALWECAFARDACVGSVRSAYGGQVPTTPLPFSAAHTRRSTARRRQHASRG